MTNIEVIAYSEHSFESIFKDEKFQKREIATKPHIKYLKSYFAVVVPKTILLEDSYIDKDHLEDYSNYYVRSFHDYSRFCKRAHFFRDSFNETELLSFINGDGAPIDTKALNDSYIGFIVIKPLPQTYIGRTCLSTYPTDETRTFPPVRHFTAHMFGVELDINTIPFQEQDSVVAACASIALWSCLYSTGHKFHHHIPSPVEITKNASELFPFLPRHFPNHGLTFEQIAVSFRKYGLEPYLVSISKLDVLQAAVRAYLGDQIPIILGLELLDQNSRSIGYHAVTILGANYKPDDNTGCFRYQSIDKLYVHDDQVGPFARMEFSQNNVLTTSWGASCTAKPKFIAIPLTSEIRIAFIQIHLLCQDLLHLIQLVDQFVSNEDSANSIIIDYYLSTINDIKAAVLKNTEIDPELKLAFLTKNHPLHIWVVKININHKWIELYMDATDIDQGDFCLTHLSNSEDFKILFANCQVFYDVLKSQNPKLLASSHTVEILNKLV